MVVWLVLMTATGALHVGNFPDMQTCLAAASLSQGRVMAGQPQQGEMVCVQASVTDGPPPPP